jgi:signal peptidase I
MGETMRAPERAWVSEIALFIVLLLFATTELIQSFVIPTVSMEDTLLRGDHLLVDKLAYAPGGVLSKYLLPYREVRRGDIVVFRWPGDIRQNYVKRVIGIPGDRLRIVQKQLILNGKTMQEPYVRHKSAMFDWYRDYFPGEPNVQLGEAALEMLEHSVVKGDLVVPAGEYFVMGDNRDNSQDSRYWGLVPRANIVGKPLLVFWSYDAPTEQLADRNLVGWAHLTDLARHFFGKTRWRRTFRFLRGYPLD